MKLTITGTADELKKVKPPSVSLVAIQEILLFGDDIVWTRIPYENVTFVIEDEASNIEEPKRWRAEQSERYYFVNIRIEIDCNDEWGTPKDCMRWEAGNYFSTRKEAEAAARKIRAVLRGE